MVKKELENSMYNPGEEIAGICTELKILSLLVNKDTNTSHFWKVYIIHNIMM